MEKQFWNDVEGWSREQIKGDQLTKLKEQVRHLNENSAYYGRIFKANGITPEMFKSLDDLERIPFIDKHIIGESEDKYPPFGEFLCVPEREIVRFFRTSGTTLEPRNFAYTWYDWWDISTEVAAREFYAMGVRPEDRAFIAFPYSTFVSLWSSHYAAEMLGCMVIPGGGISTRERLLLMKSMKATFLCATPTYAHRLAVAADEEGIDIRSIPVRIVKTGGEPLSAVPGSRRRLEELWQAKVYDEYGASESLVILGGECTEQQGLHMPEDFIIAEILDEHGKEVPPGEPGELVFSNIASKSMPMLRFKTADLVTYTDEPCACGRNTRRIKVIGRRDDMLLIKGTNVFPSMVEEIVRSQRDLNGEFMIVVDEVDGVYELILQVEPKGKEQMRPESVEEIKARIVEITREKLRLRPVVQVMEPGSLPRFEVKAKRVVDKRKE